MKLDLGYLPVTRTNLGLIEKELKNKKGKILVIEPGNRSDQNKIRDLEMHLYDHPKIRRQQRDDVVYTERGSKMIGGEPWQTGYEKDRLYLLRLKKESHRHELVIGDYALFLGFEDSVECSIFPDTYKKIKIALYIPHEIPLTQAFTFALNSMFRHFKPKPNLTKENIDKIVEFMVHDLQTGEVFRDSVATGMALDL